MPLAKVNETMVSELKGTWEMEMQNAPCSDPMNFCYGFCCFCCMAMQQREEILDLTGEPFVCCGGMLPCFNTPCNDRQPWMCLEACCCTNIMVQGNRYIIQTRYNVRNDPCDDTLMNVVAFCQMLSVCASIFCDEDSADSIGACADCVSSVVCACMLTQQKAQINKIKELQEAGRFKYGGPQTEVFNMLPPLQQQMITASPYYRPGGAPAPVFSGPSGATAPGASPATPLVTAPATIQMTPMGPAAPAPAAARQMVLTVPNGAVPGQMITFETPEGVKQQVPVPPGMSPGQTFLAQY